MEKNLETETMEEFCAFACKVQRWIMRNGFGGDCMETCRKGCWDDFKMDYIKGKRRQDVINENQETVRIIKEVKDKYNVKEKK